MLGRSRVGDASLRGRADNQPSLSHVFNVDDRLRPDHPPRDIKRRADRVLVSLAPQLAAADSHTGRPGVPPERPLKALSRMALCSPRGERHLCERLDTDLLFRWSLDLQPGGAAFDATTVTHHRARLDGRDLTRRSAAAAAAEALTAGRCSERFGAGGTLIESCASAKRFRPIAARDGAPSDPTNAPPDGNGFKPRHVGADSRGQKRTSAAHKSRTGPGARPCRKGVGQGAKLAHPGHAPGENRHGLIRGITVTGATGTAGRTAALDLPGAVSTTRAVRPRTPGSDKGHGRGACYRELAARGVGPHGAMAEQRLRDPGGSSQRGGRTRRRGAG
jgi:hypothetical protein